MNAARKNQAGFTLVEVLVSLFIFALLSAATLAVLTTSLDSRERLKAKSSTLQKQSMMRILIKSDLANTISHRKIDPFGQPETITFAGGIPGDEQVLRLSRVGWENPGGLERRSNLQSVAYVLEEGVLKRRVQARFNAMQDTPVYEQELVKDIDTIRFGFFDGQQWVDNWTTGAPPIGIPELPKLASIEISYENGKSINQIFWVGADQ